MMADINKIRLTGGVFFFLLKTFAVKNVTHREYIDGKKEKNSNLKIMTSLLKLFTGIDWKCSAKDVSQYMNCKANGSAGVPLNNKAQIDNFIIRVKRKYDDVMQDMTTFISEHINLNMKENLVSALICIIENDDDIPEEQEFFINEDGSSLTKENIRNEKEFSLASFLLGVFYYIEEKRYNDNILGQNTLDLISQKNFKNTTRTYNAKIIKNKEIMVKFDPNEIKKEENVFSEMERNILSINTPGNSFIDPKDIDKFKLKFKNAKIDDFGEESDMNIYYKSSMLGKKYIDIMDYIKKKKYSLIDLNSNKTSDFKENVVYKYGGMCDFERGTGDFYSQIKVLIDLNGTKMSSYTSEYNWINRSLVCNYIDYNRSRYCVCYFILDQEKVFIFLQISEE